MASVAHEVVNSGWAAQWWGGIASSYSDATLQVWVTFGLVCSAFWLYAALILVLDFLQQPAALYATRLQSGRPMTTRNLARRILLPLANQVFLQLPVHYLVYWSGKLDSLSLSLPTWWEVVGNFALGTFVSEIVFFYTHLLLHTPWLYKHVHAVHHEYRTPTAMAAIYAHPVEFLLANMLLANATLLLVPGQTHVLVYWAMFVFGILGSMTHHCGYVFPFYDAMLVAFHDYHHENPRCNYGVYGWLDILHGTYRPNRRWRRLQAQADQDATALPTSDTREKAKMYIES